jgi:hypothetical protein
MRVRRLACSGEGFFVSLIGPLTPSNFRYVSVKVRDRPREELGRAIAAPNPTGD